MKLTKGIKHCLHKNYGKWKPFHFSDLVVEELVTLAVFSSVSKGAGWGFGGGGIHRCHGRW